MRIMNQMFGRSSIQDIFTLFQMTKNTRNATTW